MSISNLLKEQQKWMSQAAKNLEDHRVTAKDLEFSDSMKKKREADIKNKIVTLKTQKDAALQRYDRAIVDQEKELARVKESINLKDLTNTKTPPKGKVVVTPGRTNPVLKKTPTKTKPTAKKTPTKPSTAKTLKRKPTRKSSSKRTSKKKK